MFPQLSDATLVGLRPQKSWIPLILDGFSSFPPSERGPNLVEFNGLLESSERLLRTDSQLPSDRFGDFRFDRHRRILHFRTKHAAQGVHEGNGAPIRKRECEV
jgi:hypothetical protein